ncbi:glycoside hydrolase [Mollisia scopiformis]|uniref:chitinase n=1 Tax=Mollisia scopiformis TaxID=149040 RepID=A0A194XFI3_MOLSC|nr:glycoside hydrolase [Mollisia scopiformis]KUJ18894.1 glycoside hydrolase [Mollisia scopiformis]
MVYSYWSLFCALAFASYSSASATTSTRNIIWVDGPDQGTNQTDSGTPDNITQLVTENTRVTHVILSSAHLNNPTDAPPYVNFWSDLPINSSKTAFIWPQVKQLQQNGVKVLLSFGGADDGSWGHLLDNFAKFYAPLLQALKDYEFDGIDLDIETDYTTAGALQLLEKLNDDMGSDFILTMSPVQDCLSESGDCSFGSINYQYLDNNGSYPDRANSKLVSWYNGQFYAGGGDGANSPSEYETVVDAGFDASRVVFGVADCSVDGSGWYPLSTYNSTVTQLREKYGSDFGGAFGWDWNNAGSCDGLAHPWQWRVLFCNL